MKPYYYKQMDKESSIPDKTFGGQNLILPKIMVPPGSQTANPVSDHLMVNSNQTQFCMNLAPLEKLAP